MNSTVAALISERLLDLKKKSFQELAALPDSRSEKVKDAGTPVTLTVWRDLIEGREVQVVVQVYRYWMLGMGRMFAQGFRVDAAGNLRDLTPEELYDFS